MANRDPAQGVINWFVALMACMFFIFACVAGLGVWGVWRLVCHLFGG